MAAHQQHPVKFLLIFSVLFCMDIFITHGCPDDELYVIRSTASPGLVLDGNDTFQVKIQNFTGSSPQLWQFQRADRAGLYYVANNHTKNVLTFVQRDLPDLVTTPKKDGLDQQWSLTLNGRIVNAANRQNIDIWKANYTAGNRLIGADDNGNQAQEFSFEVVSAAPDVCRYLLR